MPVNRLVKVVEMRVMFHFSQHTDTQTHTYNQMYLFLHITSPQFPPSQLA